MTISKSVSREAAKRIEQEATEKTEKSGVPLFSLLPPVRSSWRLSVFARDLYSFNHFPIFCLHGRVPPRAGTAERRSETGPCTGGKQFHDRGPVPRPA